MNTSRFIGCLPKHHPRKGREVVKWTEDMNKMVSTGRNKMLEMLVSAGIIDSKEEVV